VAENRARQRAAAGSLKGQGAGMVTAQEGSGSSAGSGRPTRMAGPRLTHTNGYRRPASHGWRASSTAVDRQTGAAMLAQAAHLIVLAGAGRLEADHVAGP